MTTKLFKLLILLVITHTVVAQEHQIASFVSLPIGECAIFFLWPASITAKQPSTNSLTSTVLIPPINHDLLKLSENLLYAVKTENATEWSIEKKLATLEIADLITGLSDDVARKTFWVNIYNAWYQLLYIREKKRKPKIFTAKSILIAQHYFSLDDIEHGILRRYRWKYSMGYWSQFFPSKHIKQLAVSNIDYRIHFALNCGAKSCPPIAFYNYENLEQQFNDAAHVFLNQETEVDSIKKIVHTSKILTWFKGDFGGRKKILSLLSAVLNKDFDDYKLRFKQYNWDADPKNYNE